MVGIGWSIGDILAAIQFIRHIAQAFDNVKGARKDYAKSSAFLCALAPVLDRLTPYLDKDDSLHDDMQEAASVLLRSYKDFADKLEKRHGLSSKQSRSVESILDTLKWSLDDLHDRVQKLKVNVLDALTVVENLIVSDIRVKVDILVNSVKDAEVSNQRREGSLDQTSHTLAEIRDHIAALEQVSSDYTSKLGEVRRNQHAQADDVNDITEKLEKIKKSQEELAESLKELTSHIQKQSQQMETQAEADKWNKLQYEAQGETIALDQQLKIDHEKTIGSLGDTSQILSGTAGLTKNAKLQGVSNQVTGVSQIIGALGPITSKAGKSFGGFFGSKSNAPEPPQSASSSSISRPDGSPQRPSYTPRPQRAPAPLQDPGNFLPPPRKLPPASPPPDRHSTPLHKVASTPPLPPRCESVKPGLPTNFPPPISRTQSQIASAPSLFGEAAGLSAPLSPRRSPQLPPRPTLPNKPAWERVVPPGRDRSLTADQLSAMAERRPPLPARPSSQASTVSDQDTTPMSSLTSRNASCSSNLLPNSSTRIPQQSLRPPQFPPATPRGKADHIFGNAASVTIISAVEVPDDPPATSRSVKDMANMFEGHAVFGVRQ